MHLSEFIGAVPDHPAIVVTEFMDCTLRDALKSKRIKLNQISPISMQIAQGLHYLHDIKPRPIIHGNINASNIYLKAAGFEWIAKLSYVKYTRLVNIKQVVTPAYFLYTAPELQQRETVYQQTVKMDVYSFGVLLIEMLTGEMPTGSIEALMKSIPSRWPCFVPLITSCTIIDPNQRPSMRQVINQLDLVSFICTFIRD